MIENIDQRIFPTFGTQCPMEIGIQHNFDRAIRSNIEEEIIAKMNAHTVLTNFNIKSCHTNNPLVDFFHKFSKNNPQTYFHKWISLKI